MALHEVLERCLQSHLDEDLDKLLQLTRSIPNWRELNLLNEDLAEIPRSFLIYCLQQLGKLQSIIHLQRFAVQAIHGPACVC